MNPNTLKWIESNPAVMDRVQSRSLDMLKALYFIAYKAESLEKDGVKHIRPIIEAAWLAISEAEGLDN